MKTENAHLSPVLKFRHSYNIQFISLVHNQINFITMFHKSVHTPNLKPTHAHTHTGSCLQEGLYLFEFLSAHTVASPDQQPRASILHRSEDTYSCHSLLHPAPVFLPFHKCLRTVGVWAQETSPWSTHAGPASLLSPICLVEPRYLREKYFFKYWCPLFFWHMVLHSVVTI